MEENMEWYQVLMIILSTFGMGWAMFANLGNKIDRIRDDIAKETKDFHGKLERQNAEFHGWVRLMDEKIKNINHKN